MMRINSRSLRTLSRNKSSIIFIIGGWVFRNVAFDSTEVRNFFTDEIELQHLIQFPQRMIATHSFVQVHMVAPQLLLWVSPSLHIEADFTKSVPVIDTLFEAYLANTPSLCAL